MTINLSDVTLAEASFNPKSVCISNETDFKVFPIETFIDTYSLRESHIEFLDSLVSTCVMFGVKKPVIGGGFLRRWMQGEELQNMTCDIDIYLRGKNKDNKPRIDMMKYFETSFGSKNTIEGSGHLNGECDLMWDGKKWELQVMHPKFNIWDGDDVSQIKQHLMTYDSPSSMFAYDTSERIMVFHELAVEHAQKKIYEFNTNCTSKYPTSQLTRLFKFSNEGYQMDYHTKMNIIKWFADNVVYVGNSEDDPYHK